MEVWEGNKISYIVQFEGSIDGLRAKDTYCDFASKATAMKFAKGLRKQHDNKHCMILVVRNCPEEIFSVNWSGYGK